jgi:hypothetical protein
VPGRSALVADDLAAGRLVRPFELSLPAGFAYYVLEAGPVFASLISVTIQVILPLRRL